MEEQKKSFDATFFFMIAISILFGIVFTFIPDGFTKLLVIISGVALILYGAVELYQYFKLKINSFLVLGIILIGAGIFCLVNPIYILGFIGAILGIFLIILGVIESKKSFDLKNLGFKNWWIWLIFSICVCLLGVSGLFNPTNITGFFSLLIGIGFLINGISSLVLFIIIKIKGKE